MISKVEHSGTYMLRNGRSGNGFSANIVSAATDTSRVDKTTLDETLGAAKYSIATKLADIDFSNTGSATAIPLRSPAMLLALIVFLLEQILSNRFYGAANKAKEGLA